MKSIFLICVDNYRARAYASAIERACLGPINGIFYGSASNSLPSVNCDTAFVNEIWVPEVNTPVREIFDRNGWFYNYVDVSSINKQVIAETITTLKPDLLIFAGKSGEIVSSTILELGVPILHLHPGALPSQRGSTTIYYSILESRPCSVSAILLSSKIDSGPVLKINEYLMPPSNVDVDVVFDSAIRADSLVKLLELIKIENKLPEPLQLDLSKDKVFYVIHPVLKHIALLSLKS